MGRTCAADELVGRCIARKKLKYLSKNNYGYININIVKDRLLYISARYALIYVIKRKIINKTALEL